MIGCVCAVAATLNMTKLFKPYVSWTAIINVVRVLLGSQIAEGPQVKKFEREFAERFNLSNVVSVNSGSAALELAYELAGLTKGDEVITPVLTCSATNIPLVRRGVKIVFADIDKDLNLSIEDVAQRITPRTKAIVFVHFGGNNRGLKEVIALGRKHNLTVIEDAAQAVGSTYWGKADFTCVSLQAIKTLTSGDGGVLICKRKVDSDKARKLRWFGYDREAKQAGKEVDLLDAGYKYHMNDIAAAIGRGNLKVIDKLIRHRQRLMEVYKIYGLMSSIWLTAGYVHDYYAFKDYMASHGIEIGQHHYRNDKYTLFGGRQTLPMMDEIEKHYFFVPMHHGVTTNQAHEIGRLYHDYVKA